MSELFSLPQQSTYSAYENGYRKVPNNILLKYFNLGVDLNWLVTGDSESCLNCKIFNYFLQKNTISTKTLSKSFNKPELFFNAMIKKEIVPSIIYISNILKHYNIDFKNIIFSNNTKTNIQDYTKTEELKNSKSNHEIILNLQSQNKDLINLLSNSQKIIQGYQAQIERLNHSYCDGSNCGREESKKQIENSV